MKVLSENQLLNPQELSSPTPDGASLWIASGVAEIDLDVNSSAGREARAVETYRLPVGPTVTGAVRAVGSVWPISLGVTRSSSFDFQIGAVEADLDDESGRVELTFEASLVLPKGPTGNRLLQIWHVGYQVIVVGQVAPSDTSAAAASEDVATAVGSQQPSTITLTVTNSGSGNGTVVSEPSGIKCGSLCAVSFDSPTTVTLTAIPAAGSMFVGWSGGGCVGTSPCVVEVLGGTTVTAVFDATQQVVGLELLTR